MNLSWQLQIKLDFCWVWPIFAWVIALCINLVFQIFLRPFVTLIWMSSNDRLSWIFVTFDLRKTWTLVLVLFCENEHQRWDTSRYLKVCNSVYRMYIVTRLISDVHFHITGPKLTFKTYNYRQCNTSMSLKCFQCPRNLRIIFRVVKYSQHY